MHMSVLPLTVRLHRYGFLLTADMAAAGRVLDALVAHAPANDPEEHTSSRERELFRQFTASLKQQAPTPHTNLRFLPAASPVSPASFAAALWGMPFTVRSVILLVCVEGFCLAEAAFIANMPLCNAEHSMERGLFALGPA